jgi:hypothetical protein
MGASIVLAYAQRHIMPGDTSMAHKQPPQNHHFTAVCIVSSLTLLEYVRKIKKYLPKRV